MQKNFTFIERPNNKPHYGEGQIYDILSNNKESFRRLQIKSTNPILYCIEIEIAHNKQCVYDAHGTWGNHHAIFYTLQAQKNAARRGV